MMMICVKTGAVGWRKGARCEGYPETVSYMHDLVIDGLTV